MNITDIFISIFNASITASIIALAVISVRLIFRKAPKFLTVLLWAMVAIRLVCPFSVESRMSLMPQQDFIQPETVYSGTSKKPDLGEIFSSVTAENPVDYEFTINDGSLQFSEITAPDEEHINPLLIMSSVMSVVWVFGLCGMLLYALISFLRLKKTVSSAISVRENEYICDDIKTPFILGVIRPKIYLPSDMDEETASCVIAHEKAHIKRRDHLWKPLGFILLSVYWFNPVMWLSYVLLCRDIELACDEKVIRQMEGKGKKAYSKALLSCSAPRSMITACPVAFGEVGVKQRIKSVLSYKKPAFWVIIASVAASVIVALCFMTDPVDETNGGKNYISVYEIEEGSFSEMEEMLSTSNMLKMRKGEKEYFNATPLGGGSSNVIGFLESLSLGSTQEREFNFAEVDGCITVLGDTHNGVEIYFAKDYSRLWLRSLADSSYSSVYVVLNVEQARNFFENREYLNDVAIWEFDSLSSADGHRKLYFYLDNEYELAESTNVIESEEHGLKGISWSPSNASDSSYLEESSTIYAVRNGENVELTVTMTKVGENEHGGVYFRISADEDTVLSGYGNGYEYVLGKVESDNSEGYTYSQPVADENSAIKPSAKDTLQEESGNDDSTVISPAQSGKNHESALKICNISMTDYSSIPDDSDVLDDSMRFIECDEKACLLPEVIKTGREGNFDYAIHEGGFAQILKYYGNESIVEIPEVIDNYPVSFIGVSAFAEGDTLGDLKDKTECAIEKVVCPDTVLCIANDAFYGCRRLENIDFSKNLVCVGNLAFAHCEALNDIAFPGSLEAIGWCSFENIGITQVTIPSSLEYVGSGAFSDCRLLNKIDFQGGTIFFGSGIIEGSSLENLYIPANLTIVGDGGMFCSENLRKVEYAETMDQETIIYAEMYKNCSNLQEIKLPSNVSLIEEYAFQGCYALKKITIPESVKSIETWAFMHCYMLTDVYFESKNCDGLNDTGLSGKIRRIHAPAGGNIEDFCNKNLLLQHIEANAI